jgi:hypothetical protein
MFHCESVTISYKHVRSLLKNELDLAKKLEARALPRSELARHRDENSWVNYVFNPKQFLKRLVIQRTTESSMQSTKPCTSHVVDKSPARPIITALTVLSEQPHAFSICHIHPRPPRRSSEDRIQFFPHY